MCKTWAAGTAHSSANKKLKARSCWSRDRCSVWAGRGCAYSSVKTRTSVDTISLREIEAIARLESAKMQHFYIGVEHLFIALTKLEGGLTTAIFEQGGQSPRYLRYATRELAGRGDDRRYLPGYRTATRATAILSPTHGPDAK